MNTDKHRYWMVVSNASKTKIFASNTPLYKLCTDLTFILELDHDESRLKSHDLETDRPGRYKTHESGGSSYEPANDIKDIEKTQFAREVSIFLKQAKSSDKYDQLLLITPKQFYGTIKTHFDHIVNDSIYKIIYKDYITRTTGDLIKMIDQEINGVQ